MLKDYRIYLYIISVTGLSLYAVSFVPALTNSGPMSSAHINEQEYTAVFDRELDYCRDQPDDINCRCFAHVSAAIQADRQPQVPNALYADKQELARWQAADSC